MQPRLLEQAAAPAMRVTVVAVAPRCSSRPAAGRPRGDVRQHLVAALAARRATIASAPPASTRAQRPARPQRVAAARTAPRRRATAAPPIRRATSPQPRASAGLQRQLVARARSRTRTHHDHPQPAQHLDDGRRGVGAVAEDLGLLALARGHDQPHLLEPRLGPLPACARRAACASRAAAGHRRVARQVEALLDGHDRRQRHVVDVAPAGDLLLAAHLGRPRP